MASTPSSLSSEKAINPCENAVRAMALLHQARRQFPYSNEFDGAINEALRVISAWSVGLVADLDRGEQP